MMPSSPVPQMTTLGEMLRYLRRRARLTQRELSIAVGYSEGQISRLEKNERRVDTATLQALFVPALGIEKEPEIIRQLLALATATAASSLEDAAAASHVPTHAPSNDELLTNLPRRLTSFVGRATAIAALGSQIPQTRLVTLTGVGGVGKTSLAAVVGSRLLSVFDDGVWWVELAALSDAKLLPQLVAAGFKLPEQAERPHIERIIGYLKDRHLLLILDNCEHLIDACAMLVDQLLRSCPHLHLLTTSREALRVDGETVWHVSPLPAPDEKSEADTQDVENLMQHYEAVRLFVERAHTTQPTLVWTAQDAASISLICRQLDGIPLAIELAASRLKGLTIDELAARLHDRFQWLTGGTRTALPRHQTLRATLDWSYYLLAEGERALLRRLSVFSGGWTLDAAEAIARADSGGFAPILNPVETLLQLVNRSLVVAETRQRETRYRLLETIREYAAEKLQEMGEMEATRAGHFAYYLSLAEQSRNPALTGQQLTNWGERIAVEMDNLRLASAWAEQQSDNGEQSLRLAGALWLFWYILGGVSEGQAWLTNALTRAMAALPETRATALYGLSYLLTLTTMPVHTRAMAEEALNLAQQTNDTLGIAHSLWLLGEVSFQQKNYARALEHFQHSHEQFQAANFPLFVNTSNYDLARVWLELGEVDKAIPLLEQRFKGGLHEEDTLFELGLVCHVFMCLFLIDMHTGRRFFEQELARQRALGRAQTLAPMLHAYGRQLAQSADLEDKEQSIEILSECLALWQQLGVQWSRAGGTARAYMDLGHVYAFKGEYALAIEYERKASKLYHETRDLHGVAWTEMAIGWPALRLGDFKLAENSFRNSLQCNLDGKLDVAPYALIGMAETMRQQGSLMLAARLFGASARFTEQEVAEYMSMNRLYYVQAARAHLNDPAFATAWAEGEAMTIEQAIAHALA